MHQHLAGTRTDVITKLSSSLFYPVSNPCSSSWTIIWHWSTVSWEPPKTPNTSIHRHFLSRQLRTSFSTLANLFEKYLLVANAMSLPIIIPNPESRFDYPPTIPLHIPNSSVTIGPIDPKSFDQSTLPNLDRPLISPFYNLPLNPPIITRNDTSQFILPFDWNQPLSEIHHHHHQQQQPRVVQSTELLHPFPSYLPSSSSDILHPYFPNSSVSSPDQPNFLSSNTLTWCLLSSWRNHLLFPDPPPKKKENEMKNQLFKFI